jgi:putative toxin-antitoxin system antitoxin component (TIGR02293 family)
LDQKMATGLAQIKTDSIRSGLPASALAAAANDVGLSREGLMASLSLPRSSIKRAESEGARLSETTSDRLYRVQRVMLRANEVFADVASARRWVTSEALTLGGVVPLSLLDTTPGYEQVLAALARIEFGLPA